MKIYEIYECILSHQYTVALLLTIIPFGRGVNHCSGPVRKFNLPHAILLGRQNILRHALLAPEKLNCIRGGKGSDEKLASRIEIE